jgi:hypothetical protein
MFRHRYTHAPGCVRFPDSWCPMRTPALHRFEHRINDRVYRIESEGGHALARGW